jgi:glycolate oxidase
MFQRSESDLYFRLCEALSQGTILADQDSLELYSHDESWAPSFKPQFVVLPKTKQEILKVLQIAQDFCIPVTPRGAGTGHSGGAVPIKGGIVLSLENMNQIKEIDPKEFVAIVEPGVITGVFHKSVEKMRLFYPPDPNSLDRCTLGGNVSTNASGPSSLKYGPTRNFTLGLEIALMNGSLIKIGRRTIKGVSGYDLVGLITGSEGTLAVITEVTLKLLPQPEEVITMLVMFQNIKEALESSVEILSHLIPRSIELLDEICINRIRDSICIPNNIQAILIIELDGLSSSVAKQEKIIKDLFRRKISEIVVHKNTKKEEILSLRQRLSDSLKELAKRKISVDIVIPRTELLKFREYIQEIRAAYGVKIASYGHVGEGNLHINIFHEDKEQRNALKAMEKILRYTISLGGTLTGEHGIGLLKAKYMPLEHSSLCLDMQRQIKSLLDPWNLLNPGKIFPN